MGIKKLVGYSDPQCNLNHSCHTRFGGYPFKMSHKVGIREGYNVFIDVKHSLISVSHIGATIFLRKCLCSLG